MALLLSKSELSWTEPAERAAFNSPVPTQIVSNGEFNPLPQTQQQRRVEGRIKEIADTIAPQLGLDRRQFLRTGCGMAPRWQIEAFRRLEIPADLAQKHGFAPLGAPMARSRA